MEGGGRAKGEGRGGPKGRGWEGQRGGGGRAKGKGMGGPKGRGWEGQREGEGRAKGEGVGGPKGRGGEGQREGDGRANMTCASHSTLLEVLLLTLLFCGLYNRLCVTSQSTGWNDVINDALITDCGG